MLLLNVIHQCHNPRARQNPNPRIKKLYTMADRELKFVCSPWSDRLVIASLGSRCQRDQKYQENRINSIYFDTLNWAFADEKAASDYLKTKVRIRWYEAGESGVEDAKKSASRCYLEVKRKIGSTREKARKPLEITPQELTPAFWSSHGISVIKKEIARLAPDLGNVDLMPRILVRYLRHRFIDPVSGARIAFDSEISGTSMAMSASERFTSRLSHSVLEVKGDEEDLPVNLRSLNMPYLRKAAFSKYYECFCLLTRYQQ